MSDEGFREYHEDGGEPLKLNTETKEQIEKFISELTDLEVKKNLVQKEIKELKDSYKEDGLPVAMVASIFNQTKKRKGKTDTERFEEDAIRTMIEESQIVDDACLKLKK